MAVKAIVDVDMSGFQRFFDLFSKYQAALAKTPGPWQQVSGQTGAAMASTQAMTVAMTTQVTVLGQILNQQRQVALAANNTASAWRSIVGYTKTQVTNIRDAVRGLDDFILRHARLGTLGAGLVGAGGLYGLDRLAGSAAGGRQQAMRLGLPYGTADAFRVNFGRLMDTDNLLSAVATAQGSAQGRANLGLAGLSQSEIEGGTGGAASALLRQFFKIADTKDPRTIGNYIEAIHAGQFGFDVNTARAFGATGAAERSQLFGGVAGDIKAFGVSDADVKAWQEFKTQMERSGQLLETTLIKGLVPLAPALEDLSKAFIGFTKSVLESPELGEWIKSVADGFKTLAEFFRDPARLKDAIFGRKDSPSIIDRAVRGAVEGDFSQLLQPGMGPFDERGAPRLTGASKLKFGTLDPELQRRLGGLISSVPEALGIVDINSGRRTEAKQEELRRNNPSGYPVARGRSAHQDGRAADVSGNAAVMKYMHDHAHEYGLGFPDKNDPVHVIIREDRSSSKPATVTIENNTGSSVTLIAPLLKGGGS